MNTESKGAKQKGKLSAFEPYALMVYDFTATFFAVFIASWGTQHWATFSGAAGACPAIAVLAVINVIVFWLFHIYISVWRYASISEAGRIVAAVTVGSVIGDVIFSAFFGKGMSLREDVMAGAILVIICGGAVLVSALCTAVSSGVLKVSPTRTYRVRSSWVQARPAHSPSSVCSTGIQI